jgi:formyltetrahydrofolate deformylase
MANSTHIGDVRPAEFVLSLSCPDRPGIVHAVASFLVERSGNILESQQFDDRVEHRFFMRVQFEIAGARTLESLREDFAEVAAALSMTWEMYAVDAPYRTLILVSKFGHCLNDLLFRWSSGHLNIDVPVIVSNHTDLKPLAEAHGIEFRHIPVTPDTKAAAEAEQLGLVDELGIHLVVLARYMQVLSEDACRALAGRAINIHHSFLPGFKGARPYHQAHARGVKQIGATAHYVTPDLDEGPIIEQDVTRVSHDLSPDRLVQAGRDVECQVLARAVKWHSEGRVLLNGSRTVVFR